MQQISAPVKDFSGVVVGVSFDKGKGETSDPAALAYFRRHGYKVEDRARPAKKAAASTRDQE